jgi:membrane-associated phospholipid phosphatase
VSTAAGKVEIDFRDAVRGLEHGDFSWAEPLFAPRAGPDPRPQIVAWYEAALFRTEQIALAEALSCACFLGRTPVAEYLLDRGVDATAGAATGMNAIHWAVNRGNLDTVRLLISCHAPLELRSTHGGTVLGTAVWSVVNEPRPDHVRIIKELLAAGANPSNVGYPSGHAAADEVLRRYGAT